MDLNDINQKFTARLKGIIAFIRALALNRTLKLCMCRGNTGATDGKRVYLPYSVFFGDLIAATLWVWPRMKSGTVCTPTLTAWT